MLYRELVEKHLEDPRVVLSDGNRAFTFRGLHEEAMRYCALFSGRRLKRGDRVLVVDRDPLETALILLACIAGGYIFVPVSRRLDAQSREQIICDCCPGIVLDGEMDNLAEAEGAAFSEREPCGGDTLAYLIYTSGSEGKPKGVLASQRQIFFCCRAINDRLGNSRRDRILCCLPLSFDYGLYQIFLAFLSGAVLFLDRGDVIQRVPYLLKRWEITAFPTIPTVANLLMSAELLCGDAAAHLRYITFTGEVLSPALLAALKAALPHVQILPMYGLTECKRVSVMPYGRDEKVMAGSCGLPLDGVSVRLEDVDPDTGIGQLVVEGDNVMEGYWGASEKSAPVFSYNPGTNKRVLHTGDLFRIDAEGFLYFCGRRNLILKIRGYRVSCAWIEERLKAGGALLEAGVTGIPDALSGERAVAFVYAADESAKRTVREQLKELPDYLRNTKLIFVKKPLPKNCNGKIDRRELQRMAEDGA